MFRVVITDYTFPSLDIEQSILQPLGCELIGQQCKTVDSLLPVVADADAIITQFAPLRAEVIQAMRNARVIVRYGIGVDNVDLDAAHQAQIPVCNVPDYCIDEVADHTLAFILAIARQVVPNCLYVRNGQWGLAVPLDQMRGLRDTVVGIVGFGRIGREVAARLAPFKSRRLVFDPMLPAAAIQQQGCEPATLDQLFSTADIVTLHCPSTADTRRMVNAERIAQLKPGAAIVNLARGDLIDTAALVEALQRGHLSAAALDVCDPEPIPLDSPLRQMSNVVLASHVASASPPAVRALRETAARMAARALTGQPLINVVNGVAAPRAPQAN